LGHKCPLASLTGLDDDPARPAVNKYPYTSALIDFFWQFQAKAF
jgi:hypothetical protein